MKRSRIYRIAIALLLIRLAQVACMVVWCWFIATGPDYRPIAISFCIQAVLAEFAGNYRVKLHELERGERKPE